MKKSCFSSAILCLIVLVGCGRTSSPSPHSHAHADSSVISTSVRGITSGVSLIKATSGKRIFSIGIDGIIGYDPRRSVIISSRVGGRVEKLYVRYNYQPVKKGMLIMEVYSAELASAQREMLYLNSSGDDSMLEKAKERLRLLGMNAGDIARVLKTGTVMYRVPVYSNIDGYIVESSVDAAAVSFSPAPSDGMAMGEAAPGSASLLSNSSTAEPVRQVQLREGQYVQTGTPLFTVYRQGGLRAEFAVPNSLLQFLTPGQKILISSSQDKQEMIAATIDLLEPVFRNGQSYGIARAFLGGDKLKAGELVRANAAITFNKGWWIPAEAVWRSGKDAFVFRKTGGVFNPVRIQMLASVNGLVQTGTDVGEWELASNASYLADSESFITPNENNIFYEE